MEIERALETQRVALLRLLTGLVVALVLVSVAPAVSLLPHWVRAHVASVLARAEAAAHILSISAAYFFHGVRLPFQADLFLPDADLTDDVPSSAALLLRIKALKLILEDLPRHARRLIKRLMKPRGAVPAKQFAFLYDTRVLDQVPLAARIERPPDKRFPVTSMTTPLTPS